jgi:epoxide hydrolase
MDRTVRAMSATPTIQPFRIAVPWEDVDDLRRRLATARWPEPAPEAPADFSRGVPLAYLQELAAYWHKTYDWRAEEERLNAVPQFTTEIDGQRVHFLHVRSPEPGALPLMLVHGYPSSVVEFLDLVGPLTDPAAHGGDAADAFDVVIPSLPGFGFSTPVRSPGWEVGRTTSAFAELMSRLGYDRYGAHGGDIGAGVVGRLGATRPEHVVGTHVVSEPAALALAGVQFPIPDHLTDEERARVDVERERWVEEGDYLGLQGHRPETIGAALTDSAVGQLAWVAEKYATWTHPSAATPDDAVGRDRLLTIVSLYWFTRSGATAARFLWEAEHSELDWIAPAGVPAGWSVFNADPIMRRFMDPEHQMPFWTEHPEAGHFPALEAPELVVDDLRAFFRPLR